MRNFKKPLTTAFAGLIASTTLIGAAQAAGSYTGDANGDEMINPKASTQTEVLMDSNATATEEPTAVTGDANGEVQIQPGASVNAEANADAPVAAPKDMVGDANGTEPIPTMAQDETAAVDMDLEGRDVVTVDGETVGEVASVSQDADGRVMSIDAEVGGFFGIGASTITIPADRFEVSANGVMLNMSEAEVKVLTNS